MGWSETAKEIWDDVKKVSRELGELTATTRMMQGQLTDFRDETRSRRTEHEVRIETRVANHETSVRTQLTLVEERSDAKIARLEARIIELERVVAALGAKTETALGDAYRVMVHAHLSNTHRPSVGPQNAPQVNTGGLASGPVDALGFGLGTPAIGNGDGGSGA